MNTNDQTIPEQNEPATLTLKAAFEKILSSEIFSDVIKEIVVIIYSRGFDKEILGATLQANAINSIEDIKPGALDLILHYISLVLDDDYLSDAEAGNVKHLKRFLKIKEGDFYNLRYYEIERILDRQFEHMYQDNNIKNEEAQQKVGLQALFDLGYDQFLELSDKAVQAAISRGANLSDLDKFVRSAY